MQGLPGEPGPEGIGIPGPKVCLCVFLVVVCLCGSVCICMMTSVYFIMLCLLQGDIGFRGLPGLPGPPGEGLQGPPVRNFIHHTAQSNYNKK